MPFWPICCESDAILFKKFRPGDRAGVFIWGNFHPGYRDIGRKIRDLGNRARPASHMNTSIFLQRKEWRGEISETEPARLTGLIWRGPESLTRNEKFREMFSMEFYQKYCTYMCHTLRVYSPPKVPLQPLSQTFLRIPKQYFVFVSSPKNKPTQSATIVLTLWIR